MGDHSKEIRFPQVWEEMQQQIAEAIPDMKERWSLSAAIIEWYDNFSLQPDAIHEKKLSEFLPDVKIDVDEKFKELFEQIVFSGAFNSHTTSAATYSEPAQSNHYSYISVFNEGRSDLYPVATYDEWSGDDYVPQYSLELIYELFGGAPDEIQ